MMKSLIILCAVVHAALGFCGNYTLHGNLTASAVQVSNWLREHYGDDVTRLEPHIASSMIVALRLAGYMPHTIMADFKTNNSDSVADYLKSHLDNDTAQNRPLSDLKPGHIALMLQAVSSLCNNTEDFYGHNLTKALLDAFISFKHNCMNDFEYSLVALTVCHNLGKQITPNFAGGILSKIEEISFTLNDGEIPDTLAMAVVTLSCLRQNVATSEVKALINVAIENVMKALTQDKDNQWNAQSKGLVVQAFMSLPNDLRPRNWHCNRLLSAILDEHDAREAFGNVLANIQILPALLGRSLLDLPTAPCPASNSEEGKKNKTVCVKLEIGDRTEGQEIPENVTLVVPEKTTAYEILKLAAKNNSAYEFEVLETSYGRMITSINNVQQNSETGSYWSLYENDKPARDGVDLFIPKNNTYIIFKYKQCGSSEEKSTNFSEEESTSSSEEKSTSSSEEKSTSKPDSDEGNTA